MRLKTKLVLAFTGSSMLIASALLSVFLVQLLRDRLDEAGAASTTLGEGLLLSTRQALESGLGTHPPTGPGEVAFEQAVIAALQNSSSLRADVDGIVRYDPIVQDVFISGANGRVLVSSDPLQENGPPPRREPFDSAIHGTVRSQLALVFGRPRVMDLSFALHRNGRPFLFLHLGVRSTLLRNALLPWLRQALWIGLGSLACSILAAVLLATLSVRPIERINRRLEALGTGTDEDTEIKNEHDAERQADSSMNRIDARMRRSAERTTDLETNLSQMLHTLQDGVLLLSMEGMIVLSSDAVQQFLTAGFHASPGHHITQAFAAESSLGTLLVQALTERKPLLRTPSTLEDGSTVEVTLAFPQAALSGSRSVGAMLTLHNAAAQQAMEQEIEVGRRLASIGRLTAGVGHEVKNPINAMVLHLELLRGKLGNKQDATRHVDVLASEMRRLDRVVQTLADFTRPLEAELRSQRLRPIVDAVMHLVSIDLVERKIQFTMQDDAPQVLVKVDAELLHQALLNVVLNAMDAMPAGGNLRIALRRVNGHVQIAIQDSGHGISPDMLERIFHLYFTTKSTGTGIGLAMTWRIVQTMGGTIQVRSQTLQSGNEPGTLFVVEFPLSHEPQQRITPRVEPHAV